MHVGFLGPRAEISPARQGAIEKITMDLAAGLAARGHDVTVFTLGEAAPRRYEAEGVDLRVFAPPERRPPSYVFPAVSVGRRATDVVADVHAETPLDVLHATFYPHLLGFDAPADLPVVVTEHNAHPWRKEHAFAEGLTAGHRLRWEADTYLRRLEALAAFRHAEQVLSVSDAQGAWMERVVPGLAAKRETMYNPVDTTTYRPDVSPPTGLPSGDVVLYAGRKVPHKGLHRLVEAMSRMTRPATLVVLGPLGAGFDADRSIDEIDPEDVEGYLGRVLTMIDRLSLHDRVSFPGFVADDVLPGYYAAADVVAFPSVLESFGMIPIEAMACGTPVVAHDVPPMTETVRDPETGHLVAPTADALADALDDVLDAPSGRYTQAARTHVEERYSLERVLDRHLRVYRSVSA